MDLPKEIIAPEWKKYERLSVADRTNPEQREILRNAFYAGFHTYLHIIMSMNGQAPDEIDAAMGTITAELKAWSDKQFAAHLVKNGAVFKTSTRPGKAGTS